MAELAKDISRLSGDRARYDPRRRRLALHDARGAVLVEVEATEFDLRNWLQRLLLATPDTSDREPQEKAVLLLLDQLTAALAGADPGLTQRAG